MSHSSRSDARRAACRATTPGRWRERLMMGACAALNALRRSRVVAIAFIAGILPLGLAAFPPSPHYTLFGLVRDQVGTVLQVEGAEIVLLSNNSEIGRTTVYPSPRGDYNYELDIRIDQARPTTRSYTSKAVAAQGIYSLVVEMNGQRYYPIEVSGTLRAGNGGERVRLDLTLGADSDGDGLPDAWEEWQLFQAGRRAGPNGWDLSLIDRDGDFDGDGVSNRLEYIAGTFAGDATERFELRIVGKTSTTVACEFYAIVDKVYSIEASADLRTWTAAPFALAPGGATTLLHRATAVGTQSLFVPAGGSSRFYRLVVR